ncbi:MAG: hypothetical protein KKG59_06865 [Nanoarchaeota archaeon]|nr:hypothetical protein [Nanoarchaeota archaeon]
MVIGLAAKYAATHTGKIKGWVGAIGGKDSGKKDKADAKAAADAEAAREAAEAQKAAAASAATIAAASTAASATSTYSKSKKKPKGKSKKKDDDPDKGIGLEKFIFLIAFFTHVIDASMGFDRTSGAIISRVLFWYMGVGLLTSWVFSSRYDIPFWNSYILNKEFWKTTFGAAVAATYLPYAVYKAFEIFGVPELLYNVASNPQNFIFVFFLIFPVYIFFVWGIWSSSTLSKYMKRWITILIVLCLLTYPSEIAAMTPGAVGEKVDATALGETFIEWSSGRITSVYDIIAGTPAAISESVNRIYEPYFYGEVEENKDDYKLGVYLTNLEPLVEPVLQDDEEIVVWADIQGKTFTGDIEMHNFCTVEYRDLDREIRIVTGQIEDGFDTLKISDFEDNSLTCTIDRTGIETKDSAVTVNFFSIFTFTTWGYLDYSFMERKELMNRRRSGEDVAKELGISDSLTAVYTQGPVSLGMVRSIDPPKLPYSLDAENPKLPLFGVTFENAPSYRKRGEIHEITKVVFHVPAPITLDGSSCNPDVHPTKSYDPDSNYNLYTFNGIDIRPEQEYQSLRCRMNINPNDVNEFLGEGGVALATFAVETEYMYKVQESVRVQLQKPIDPDR